MAASDAAGPDQETLWIQQIAVGDRSAFEGLYRVYQPRLYAFAYRMLRDEGGAAEVTNDVMVTVWKQAAQFEGRSRPATWIFGIAHHKALNELRRRRSRPEHAIDEAAAVPDPGEGAAATIERADLRNRLKAAMLQLPAEQAEVLNLTYFQGLAYQQIADALACPLNTVKTRVFHAKKKLQPILEAMGIGKDAL
jgi:RNA polymerase sigma-70 factor (ECF subfamily)